MKSAIFRLGVVVAACAAVSGGCASQPAAQPAPQEKVASADQPAGKSTDVAKVDLTAGPKAPPAPQNSVSDATNAVVATITTSIDTPQGQKTTTSTITLGQLIDPLIETQGLNALLTLVQLELAKQMVEQQGQVVTEADISKEREATFSRLFQDFDANIDEQIAAAEAAKDKVKADKLRQDKEKGRAQLLENLYKQQRITPGEFEILIRTNTYLRRVALPLLKDKITEEMIQKQFGVRYGETIRVHHIQFKRAQDAVEIRRRLANEPFEKVAREMSTNRQTGPLGGELPPFSRQEKGLPPNFINVAFSLTKVGEVSDTVEADGTYHIIRLDERIMPKAVKYETVRQAIFDDLQEQYIQAVIKGLRERIGEVVRGNLKIQQPVLARQFAEGLAKMDATANAKKRAEEEWEKERRKLEAQQMVEIPGTQPTTRPAAPTTRGSADENLRTLTAPATTAPAAAPAAATPK